MLISELKSKSKIEYNGEIYTITCISYADGKIKGKIDNGKYRIIRAINNNNLLIELISIKNIEMYLNSENIPIFLN